MSKVGGPVPLRPITGFAPCCELIRSIITNEMTNDKRLTVQSKLWTQQRGYSALPPLNFVELEGIKCKQNIVGLLSGFHSQKTSMYSTSEWGRHS